MTIRELKESIANLPDDMAVILQKDSEGNGYSPLAAADPDVVYVPDSTYSGKAYSTDYTADDCCMTDAEHRQIMAMPRCLVLAPVN